MKRFILTAMMAAILGTLPVQADMQHGSADCTKHCNSMQLDKEVKRLENEITANKQALKTGSADKAAALNSKRDALRKHIEQHERELEGVRSRLNSSDAQVK